MKRIGLVCLGLALGAASTVHAQGLTMQMSNGWSFTFSGNVNSFIYYTATNTGGTTVGAPGGLVPPSGTVRATRITVGLLPAFAVFDAKGKEGNTDLGVHFGFAPSVQCGEGVNDCFGTTIDMRQVYLTIGGSWGQLLVGRELGLFNRQNILTDQTLFGIGGSGAGGPDPIAFGDRGGSTTLGRIGYGYVYPNFRAQMTYSTKAGQPYSFAIGLFEAAQVGIYNQTQIPRVETEFSYSASGFKGWLGGTLESTKDAPRNGVSLTSYGGSGGLRYEKAMFSITGSGYYGKGLGTTFYGAGGSSDLQLTTSGKDDARKSYGFIGQITVTPTASKVTIAGSYGSSYLKASNNDKTAGNDFRTENTLISGGIYYQATKSLKVVGEFDYEWTKLKVAGSTLGSKNTRYTPGIGFMLFF
ncbi:MAG TPA: hypothetical protein VE091_02105 [Gemmatimonadales bacterium]|nr:hypothetical protein [Gemmatimonadales bacterium]